MPISIKCGDMLKTRNLLKLKGKNDELKIFK